LLVGYDYALVFVGGNELDLLTLVGTLPEHEVATGEQLLVTLEEDRVAVRHDGLELEHGLELALELLKAVWNLTGLGLLVQDLVPLAVAQILHLERGHLLLFRYGGLRLGQLDPLPVLILIEKHFSKPTKLGHLAAVLQLLLQGLFSQYVPELNIKSSLI